MKHFGDITKLNGYDLPTVDIVTGGSPCQDLSVAGKRAGLLGERSGLFMEQIRLIKEMRKHDELEQLRSGRAVDDIRPRPRFMVWENVIGAFSSNGGKDFRCVLEETAKVAEGDARIPEFTRGGWPHSGCIMGTGWSIAWRVHDAQFWGVPQRRKRIALVADFGGQRAPEILFESEGVSWDSSESEEARKEVARDFGGGTKESGERSFGGIGEGDRKDKQPDIGHGQETISFQERAGKPGGGKGILIQKERTGALSTLNNQSVLCKETIGSLCARDYKGVGEQYVNEGKVIVQHGECDMPE